MEDDVNDLDKMAILTEITDLAAQLGWVVALPPENNVDGIFIGTKMFIERYNNVLPLENNVDIMDNFEPQGKMEIH